MLFCTKGVGGIILDKLTISGKLEKVPHLIKQVLEDRAGRQKEEHI